MRRVGRWLWLVPALAVLLTVALDFVVWNELTPRLRAPLEPLAQVGSLSASRCAACHVEISREWSESRHAAAFVDPLYQADLAQEGTPYFCVHRHAPLVE